MTTINDLLWDSITLQGTLIVSKFDSDTGDERVLYEGDAEWVREGEDEDGYTGWLDEDINYIFPDPKKPDTLHIELVFE